MAADINLQGKHNCSARGYTRFVQPFDASRQALREHGRPRAADTHVEDEFGDDQFWREQFGQLWSERCRS